MLLPRFGCVIHRNARAAGRDRGKQHRSFRPYRNSQDGSHNLSSEFREKFQGPGPESAVPAASLVPAMEAC
eukprot:4371976-Pyramimonas_sp.AAC.1